MRSVTTNRWLLVAACVLLFSSTANGTNQGQLSAEEQKVIDYLMKDWGQDFSVTSVDIAMSVLKMKPSDETRFRIGNYIKTHPELHEIVRRWGWVTLVLTPDEKLIARALINAERDSKPTPSLSELAKAVAVSEPDVKRGLNMLEQYEVLQKDSKAGYRVVPRYIKWEPRLDFVFHKVSLDNGRQFNTN
jgi:hypothetical protein